MGKGDQVTAITNDKPHLSARKIPKRRNKILGNHKSSCTVNNQIKRRNQESPNAFKQKPPSEMQSKLEQQLRVQETVPGQQHKPKQKVSASEQIPKTKV